MAGVNRPVSVLFARSDSCYNELVSDVWDSVRDARNYSGDNALVCHPPCRGWGRLRHFAKPRPDEKALALFAVRQIRRCGGVLEHPWGSTLWRAAGLPFPGRVDEWGGFTLLLDQGWWGHPAPKPTYVYVCGANRADVPDMPVQIERAKGRTLDLSPADRERTPPLFAQWLVLLASRCGRPLLQPAAASSLLQPPGFYTEQPDVVTPDQGRCNTDLVSSAAAKRAAFRAWAGAS